VIAPFILVLAFVFDLFMGDPHWLPHPVQVMGRGITSVERRLRGRFAGERERLGGIVLVLSIVLPSAGLAFALGKVLLSFTSRLPMMIGTILFIYLASTTLALRGLISSSRLVIKALKNGDIVEAREKLSMIVGRDTDALSEKTVLQATIETVAENLSDGFIAPLFYLALGGLPLAMAYKAVNTLDSMVGYKNPLYIRFGWAAARVDDVANYIPARITGVLIAFAALPSLLVLSSASRCAAAWIAMRRSFTTMVRDGRKHTSPNSGVPEAAMAGALGVRLGGPSTYGGSVVVKPYIGDSVTNDYRASADCAMVIAATASCLAVAVFSAALLLGRRL
jgi:adenosylcobinamide-phosphate synthase